MYKQIAQEGVKIVDFDSINYFLSICNSGSFSEAAKRLYISQPTLSRRITALEEELGAELFARKSTGISLTPAGKVFYEEQVKLMDQQNRLMERMMSFRKEYAGTLSIGIRENLPIEHIFETALHMKEKHPNLDIRIFSYSISELADRYATGRIDIAVGFRNYFEGQYHGEIETIVEVAPTILIPRGHRLYNVNPLRIQDLAGEKFVITNRGHVLQSKALNIFEKHGITFREALVCGSGTARLSAAVLNNYLAIGASCWLEIYDSRSFFRSVVVPDTGITAVDLCAVYDPENALASRFAAYLQEMHFEEKNAEMETIII